MNKIDKITSLHCKLLTVSKDTVTYITVKADCSIRDII